MITLNLNETGMAFKELEIGDVYRDQYNNICIKTSHDRIIYYDAEVNYWEETTENLTAEVFPLKAELNIL